MLRVEIDGWVGVAHEAGIRWRGFGCLHVLERPSDRTKCDPVPPRAPIALFEADAMALRSLVDGSPAGFSAAHAFASERGYSVTVDDMPEAHRAAALAWATATTTTPEVWTTELLAPSKASKAKASK